MASRIATVILVFLAVFSFATGSNAEPVRHAFVAADYAANRVVWVNASGELVWAYDAPHPQDIWRLANGNLVFCHQLGAMEVVPDLTYLARVAEDPSAKDGTRVVWE